MERLLPLVTDLLVLPVRSDYGALRSLPCDGGSDIYIGRTMSTARRCVRERHARGHPRMMQRSNIPGASVGQTAPEVSG